MRLGLLVLVLNYKINKKKKIWNKITSFLKVLMTDCLTIFYTESLTSNVKRGFFIMVLTLHRMCIERLTPETFFDTKY